MKETKSLIIPSESVCQLVVFFWICPKYCVMLCTSFSHDFRISWQQKSCVTHRCRRCTVPCEDKHHELVSCISPEHVIELALASRISTDFRIVGSKCKIYESLTLRRTLSGAVSRVKVAVHMLVDDLSIGPHVEVAHRL